MVKESGLRKHEVLHIKEDSDGSVTGDLYPFASNINSVEWSPDKNTDERRGIGSADPKDFENGQETHEVTINHDLEGTIGTTEGTDYATPVGEAMVRDADNKIPEVRTIIHKETHENEGTLGGVRYYTVARHAKPNVTLSGESESGAPIESELTWNAEKVRKYEIEQPGSAGTLNINSTESEDGTVTLEDDTGTKQTISVTSGSGSTGTDEYSSLRAIHLDTEFDGDVSVDNGSATLAVIKGANSYGSIEGDRGIPVTPDTGTRNTTFGGSPQKFLGSKVNWDANEIAPELENVEVSVENNFENYARHDQFGQTVEEGNRNITVSASVVGKKQSKDKIMNYLQQKGADFKWELGSSTITVNGAEITDPGSDTKEEGQVFASMDNEFTGTGIALS